MPKFADIKDTRVPKDEEKYRYYNIYSLFFCSPDIYQLYLDSQ